MPLRIAFAASRADVAQAARTALIGRYGDAPMDAADVIVALGGTLQKIGRGSGRGRG